MTKKTINWGILGVGNVCEVKSGPAYQKTDGFTLKAVMRRDGFKAKDFAERHGVPKYYDNADALISDPEIDAIYIATPPNNHLEYALKVAEAGKICCVEKPMAITFEECMQMEKEFSEKNIPLFIAYYRRSLPRFLQIKKWLDNDAIGKMRHIDWSYCEPPHPMRDLSGEYNWRTDKNIALGGYFDDLASHGLDLFHFLLGEFKEVSGQTTNQQNLYSAYDAISAAWIHKNGITGSGFWNFGTWEEKDTVEILGEKGSITFSVFKNNPVSLRSEKENLDLVIEHPKTIQIHHVELMQKHLEGKLQHPSSGKTAMHTAWVMDKILGRI